MDRELQPQARGSEKASASPDGPRLPTSTHQHPQWQPGVQAHWPPTGMTSVPPQRMARPQRRMLLPDARGHSQVDTFFANLFLP